MNYIKRLLILISPKTIAVMLLSVLATWYCIHHDMAADFPLTLIATAVVFPIVFSIGGAYKRRETALSKYASIKAHGKAIYYAARDWMPESDEASLSELRGILRDILASSRDLFSQSDIAFREREIEVYSHLSKLSRFIKTNLRDKGLATGEVSRCNQYFSKLTVAFEDLKHIYQYRTPRTLRVFSQVTVTVLPPLYGPYFAHLAAEYPPSLAYVMPVLFSFVLVSLDNIQAHLENPFDQIGEDDVKINAENFVERLEKAA